MKLLLLFCLIEAVSLGIVWFDMRRSEDDLEQRDVPRDIWKRSPPENNLGSPSVLVSRKDTRGRIKAR